MSSLTTGIPGLLISDRRVAFVLGGAQCVWDDLKSAKKICVPDFVVCVNNIGVDYDQPFDYWVSFHGDRLAGWIEQRKKLGLPLPKHLFTGPYRAHNTPKKAKQCKHRGGSSGMLGTKVAIEEGGATHVILCGVPMDPKMPHYHDDKKGVEWKDGKNYKKNWLDERHNLNNIVKSMSGWTADLLGLPTKEWLLSIQQFRRLDDWVKRDWGRYFVLTYDDKTLTKVLEFSGKSSTSMQRHSGRDEVWLCISGKVDLIVDGSRSVLHPGDHAFVPKGAWHQANSPQGSLVIEVWKANPILSEDDIEREV